MDEQERPETLEEALEVAGDLESIEADAVELEPIDEVDEAPLQPEIDE